MGITKIITNRIKNFITGVKNVKFYPIDKVFLGSDFEFGNSPRDFIKYGYAKNPYVFQVINRICERAVDIDGFIVDKNNEEVINLEPFFSSLLNEPNEEGIYNSKYRLFANYLVTGNVSVVKKSALGFDKMTGYYIPNSDDVIIETDGFGKIEYFNVTYLNRTTRLTPDKVFHIKRPNIASNQHEGISTLNAGRKVYESNNEVWSSEAALHKNKGVSGVLYRDGNRPMSPTERKEQQKEYDMQVSGVNNFGKVRIENEKLGYIPMGMNPNDLKSIESRLDHLRTICSLYNVDSKLFNDPSASTYNNMAEAKRGLIVDAIIPLINKTYKPLIEWLAKETGNEYSYKINEDIIPELQLTKAEESVRIERYVRNGIITPQQAVQLLNLDLP